MRNTVLRAAPRSPAPESVREGPMALVGYSQGGADTDQRVGDQLRAQLIEDGRAPRIPVVLSHSRLDDVVPHRVGRDLTERWHDSGARVAPRTTVAPLHLGGYLATVRPAKAFLEARFSEAQADVRP